MCRGRNLGKARASNMWLKKCIQSLGQEQKSSELHPIIRAELSLKYTDVQFQPRNSDLFQSYMEIYALEIENEPGRPQITTELEQVYFCQISGHIGWSRATKIPHK